jgi:hypothetical protein
VHKKGGFPPFFLPPPQPNRQRLRQRPPPQPIIRRRPPRQIILQLNGIGNETPVNDDDRPARAPNQQLVPDSCQPGHSLPDLDRRPLPFPGERIQDQYLPSVGPGRNHTPELDQCGDLVRRRVMYGGHLPSPLARPQHHDVTARGTGQSSYPVRGQRRQQDRFIGQRARY